MSAIRYFHTLRYLKPKQFYGRLWFRLNRPRPDLRPSPPLRILPGQWQPPPTKQASQLSPARFRFLNKEHNLVFPKSWNDPALDKLWLYNLHYFNDLNAAEAVNRYDWHEELIQRWIKENPPGHGNGWEPYPLSLRIVNWIKWSLQGNTLSENVLHSLAVQIRYLGKRLEYHLLGNHLFANAKALFFAGLFFEGDEAEEWFATGMKILTRELPEQILADGGHFERSPMYHAIILEDLLDLVNLFRTYGRETPKEWRSVAMSMMRWLSVMCHPDGDIVLFNDAALGIASDPEKLFAYADRLGLKAEGEDLHGLTRLESTGYSRWQQGDAIVFLDVAPIGPDYLPGHAHADTLNFELSISGQRVIVDSGTSCYGAGVERLRQRSTAAHNTVTIDDHDSSEVWAGFRVARRARPIDLVCEERGDITRVFCGHDGYRRLPGRPTPFREWLLGKGEMHITDTIEGRFEKATGRFHFHPDLKLSIDKFGKEGRVGLPDGKKLSWHVSGGLCKIIDTTWHPEFGLSIPNKCLEVSFDGPEVKILFSWSADFAD